MISSNMRTEVRAACVVCVLAAAVVGMAGSTAGATAGATPGRHPTVLTGEVRAHTGMTPYARFGNWPALLLIFASLAIALQRSRRAAAPG